MDGFSRRDFLAGIGALGAAGSAFAWSKEEKKELDGFGKDLAVFEKLATKAAKVGIIPSELKDLKNGYATTQQAYNRLLFACLIRAGFIKVLKDEKCEVRCVVTWFPPAEVQFGNIEDHVKVACQMCDTDFDRIVTDADAWAYMQSTIKEFGHG